MDERATGIVLRRRMLTESSLIVHWLAEPCGRVATVAKGARRPKSPFRGKLDLFYLARFSFHRSRRSDLHILGEVTVQDSFPALRSDPDRLRHVAYAAGLIEKTTEPETPLAAIFDLFGAYLRHVATEGAHAFALCALECRLLSELGLALPSDLPGLSPGSAAFLRQAILLPWQNLQRCRPSAIQLQEMCRVLGAFLLQNLGFLPAGRDRALGVANNP